VCSLEISTILKRSLYASVFVLITACQPANVLTDSSSDSDNSEASGTIDKKISASSPSSTESLPPLLTLGELFSADDVQFGIKQAVLDKDSKALLYWQEQLVGAGREVRLSQRDLDLISGQQGLLFIEFEAKKQLFHDEFMERFINFGKIDDVINKYPYLTSVHEKAYNLISERDKVIERAAIVLREDGFTGDATQEARLRWMDFMQNSGKFN
jgi:hypothetical protein